MPSGLEMMIPQMLKAAGVDVPKLVADLTTLKKNVEETLNAINTRLTNIEKQNEEILQWMKAQASQPVVQSQPQSVPNPLQLVPSSRNGL
jgi:hypothetical protein